jgi:hypothetical protein
LSDDLTLSGFVFIPEYDLAYAVVGWVVWRNKDFLPDEILEVNYLGSPQVSFKLNLSKSGVQVLGKYYQFITPISSVIVCPRLLISSTQGSEGRDTLYATRLADVGRRSAAPNIFLSLFSPLS